MQPNGGGPRAFVHISSFTKPSKRPAIGDVIIYEHVEDPNKGLRAINVRLLTGARRGATKKHMTSSPFGSTFVAAFCVILAVSVLLQFLPLAVLYIYLTASVLAFLVYALDKSSARRGRWRTPESHLHLLSLVGGWPGAYYAQKRLRHKSSKVAFKRVFWATVLCNVALFVWLFSDQGRSLLTAFVG